jgi:hypothetical protein
MDKPGIAWDRSAYAWARWAWNFDTAASAPWVVAVAGAWAVSADSAIAAVAWTTGRRLYRYLVASQNSFASGSEEAWAEEAAAALELVLEVTAASSLPVSTSALAREPGRPLL